MNSSYYKRLCFAFFLVASILFALFLLTTPTNKKFTIKNVPTQDRNLSIKAGETLFKIGGCGSCHEGIESKSDSEPPILSGGKIFKTKFGKFYSPNISPDKEFGIGGWTLKEFSYSLKFGLSPNNEHYYPAFPYSSYNQLKSNDIVDLYNYIMSLPSDQSLNKSHELIFPLSNRRIIGLWKILQPNHISKNIESGMARGKYLVNVLGHCGECHTPRSFLGIKQNDRWLAGARLLDSKSFAPNLTNHKDGLKSWTQEDIVSYLKTGFTPDFDSVGGPMVSVVENLAVVPDHDLYSIAQYLKSLSPIDGKK